MVFDKEKFGIYCDCKVDEQFNTTDFIYTLYLAVPASLKSEARLMRVSENHETSSNSFDETGVKGHMFSIRTKNESSLQRNNNQSSLSLTEPTYNFGFGNTGNTDIQLSIGDLCGNDVSYSSNLDDFFTPVGDFIPNKIFPGDDSAFWESNTGSGALSKEVTVDGDTLNLIQFMRFRMQHSDRADLYFGKKSLRRSFDRIIMNLRFTIAGDLGGSNIINLHYNSANSFSDGKHSFFSEDINVDALSVVPDNVSFTDAINTLGDTAITSETGTELGTITTIPIPDTSYNTYYIRLSSSYVNYINALNLEDAEARTFVMNNVRDIVRSFNDTAADIATEEAIANGTTVPNPNASYEFDFNNNQVFIVNDSLPFVSELEGKNVRVLNPKDSNPYFNMGTVSGTYGIYADLDSVSETLSLTTSSGSVVTIINRDQTLGRPKLRYFEVDISGDTNDKLLIGNANYINTNYYIPNAIQNASEDITSKLFTATPFSIKFNNVFNISNLRIVDLNENDELGIKLYDANGLEPLDIRNAKELRIVNPIRTWRDYNGKIKFMSGDSNLGSTVTFNFNSETGNIINVPGGSLIVENRLYESKTVMQIDDVIIVLGSVTANQGDLTSRTYYTTTFNSIINKMIDDVALHDGKTSATIIGDPHVYTLNNKTYTLENVEKEWNYYSDENISITVNTRKVTDEERTNINNYYRAITGNAKIPKRLISNGVFVNKVTLNVNGKKIGYNFDNELFFDETNGEVLIDSWKDIPEKLRTKFEKHQEAKASKIYLSINGSRYCLLLCKYANPQMKYGVKLLTDVKSQKATGLVC
jgi:hypothetical protein